MSNYLKTTWKVLQLKKMLLIYFVLILYLPLKAQITEKFEHHVHHIQNDTIPYRLFVPDGYSDTISYPLVLTLHGAGERGTDNEKQIATHPLATAWAELQNQNENPCFIVSPQCPPNYSWANETVILDNLLDSLIFKYSIDTNRLYITGLSMGGFGTFNMLEEYPNKFAAAIPMSGGWGYDAIVNMEHIPPTWNFHGDSDGIVSVYWSRTVFAALESIGINSIYPEDLSQETLDFYLENDIKHLYSEYKNGGHEVWAQSYGNPKMIDWVFRQRLNSNEYQCKYAFNVFPDKYFALADQDTFQIYSNINNPDNHQIDAYAIITNESGSYNDSIPLFDDGNHLDGILGDGLFSNHLPAPNFEDFFKVAVSTVDKDSYDHYLFTPSYAEFTTVGPVKLGNFNIIKIDSAANLYRGELQMVLTNYSASKTIKNITAHILDFNPKNIENIDRNPIYQFGDIEPGQKMASINNLKFFFYKDTTMNFVLSIRTDDRHYWTDTLTITDIFNTVSVESAKQQPLEFTLEQNYPNPFNPSTTIKFGIPEAAEVQITIYDVVGNQVEVLVNDKLNSGYHTYNWNASNHASGIYLCQMRTSKYTSVIKMLLIK